MGALEELEKIKLFVSCNHPQEAVYLCETKEYEIIKKDLEVLEILRNQTTITEDKKDNGFGNYTMIYNLNITTKGLNWEQFVKIKEWVENE